MLSLGLGALTHANSHAAYIDFDNGKWAELSILQAAHAAEIFIKARIAEEHPLLIFSDLPRNVKEPEVLLDLKSLMENGRTYQYQDLPRILWAATGITIPDLEIYNAFGKLRNTVQHFCSPIGEDVSTRTLEFIYKVVDPFINMCWDLYAIDYNEDSEPYKYFLPVLIHSGISFNVSPEAAADKQDQKYVFEWPEDMPEYRELMEKRFAKTLKSST